MLHRGRLLPFFHKGSMYGVITFLVGRPGQFFGKDPWALVYDDPSGTECYVEQVYCRPQYRSKHNSFYAFKRLKKYVKQRFPNVVSFTWCRYKNDKLFSYQGGKQCIPSSL